MLFGRQAEIAGEYLKKGRSVYIEGRLQTRKYTDKDGVEKYSTEIVGDRMQLLGSREGGGGGDVEFGGGGAPAVAARGRAEAARARRRWRQRNPSGGGAVEGRTTSTRHPVHDDSDPTTFGLSCMRRRRVGRGAVARRTPDLRSRGRADRLAAAVGGRRATRGSASAERQSITPPPRQTSPS